MPDRAYFQLRDFETALNADIVKKSKGNPAWIKAFCGQLEDPEYRSLTPDLRGLLNDLRLLAGRRGNKVLDDEKYLNSALGYNARTRTAHKLSTLRTLRFIEPFNLAANPAANSLNRSRDGLEAIATSERLEERRGEEKNPPTPLRRKSNKTCSVAHCGLRFKTVLRRIEHERNVHEIEEAA